MPVRLLARAVGAAIGLAVVAGLLTSHMTRYVVDAITPSGTVKVQVAFSELRK